MVSYDILSPVAIVLMLDICISYVTLMETSAVTPCHYEYQDQQTIMQSIRTDYTRIVFVVAMQQVE
jgi:hypothetical protein